LYGLPPPLDFLTPAKKENVGHCPLRYPMPTSPPLAIALARCNGGATRRVEDLPSRGSVEMIYRRTIWLTILAVDVVLFVIAAVIGQHPKQHWKDVLGGIGWFGFLFCTLLLILIAVGWLVHGRRRRVTT